MYKLLSMVDYLVLFFALIVCPLPLVNFVAQYFFPFVQYSVGGNFVDLPLILKLGWALLFLSTVGTAIVVLILALMIYFSLRRGISPFSDLSAMRSLLWLPVVFPVYVCIWMGAIIIVYPLLNLAEHIVLLLFALGAIAYTFVAVFSYIRCRKEPSP